jgi:endonuclease III
VPSRSRLVDLIAALHGEYGDPFLPPTSDPFGLILWEQVAYLASDARRSEAFQKLSAEVGVTPAAVAQADPAVLTAIARVGGATAATERAARMRSSAERVLSQWAGNLTAVLERPRAEARKELQAFAMIGPPGADKILLLTGARPVLALDSNGVRALLRLGYGAEQKDYGRTYASVQAAASVECRDDCVWLARAFGLLRWHGQRICRRSTPRCGECIIAGGCPSSVANM